MPPLNFRMTSELFLSSALTLAIVDTVLILLARRLITPERFRRMKWPLSLAAGLFFFMIWTTVLGWSWDWFYSYVFRPWGRRYLPLIFSVGYAAWGAGMWWLSQKSGHLSTLTWCLLGGLEGLLSHVWAIWGLGAASKPPLLQGVDPWAVLLFAVFEKMCYWSVILLVTAALHATWERVRRKPPHAWRREAQG